MAISTKRSKTIFSSSAEKISGHDDLLLQILVCLPVKSLMKFKCVSKHWLSLIINPHFSRRSGGCLSRFPCISGLFLRSWLRTGPLATHLLDFINLDCNHSTTSKYPSSQTLTSCVDYPPEMIIIDSCNGLLLCCSSSDLFINYSTNYYICNPTTKQHIMLPPLTSAGEISRVILAFDPSKSPYYKVICTIGQWETLGVPDLKIEIYSSKSGMWRISEATISVDWDSAMHGGVFWNGGIHWITDFGPSLYFDVDEEETKEMAMPSPLPDDWGRRRVRYFGESRGHLQLVEIYNPPSTQFDLWEMEMDRSGWLLKYKVNLDGIVNAFPRMIRSYRDSDPSHLNYYAYHMLGIVEGEREEDSYMLLLIPANIIRYDLKTQNFKKLGDFPPSGSSEYEDSEYIYSCIAHQYIESLASV